MSHDPGQLAAAYLTTMRPRARRRFEAHLLACEPCWQEICLARRSRQLAETTRDLAPPGLRDDIRAAVTTAATLAASPPASQGPVMATALMAAAVLAGTIILVRPRPRTRPGARRRAARDDRRGRRQLPRRPAARNRRPRRAGPNAPPDPRPGGRRPRPAGRRGGHHVRLPRPPQENG